MEEQNMQQVTNNTEPGPVTSPPQTEIAMTGNAKRFEKELIRSYETHAQSIEDSAHILAFLTDFVITGLVVFRGPDAAMKLLSDRANGQVMKLAAKGVAEAFI